MKPESDLNKPETEEIELTSEELEAVSGGTKFPNPPCPPGQHDFVPKEDFYICTKCGATKPL